MGTNVQYCVGPNLSLRVTVQTFKAPALAWAQRDDLAVPLHSQVGAGVDASCSEILSATEDSVMQRSPP